MPTPRHITHLLDPKRGRATAFRMWSLCGESVSTRNVCRKSDNPFGREITCKACILAEALLTMLAEHSQDGGLSGDSIGHAQIALARVRGEQTQDAQR